MVKPAARRSVASWLHEQYSWGVRRACRLARIAESSYRYRSRRLELAGLRERLLELARERPRFGYRRLTAMLRREGWPVNAKRIHRLYREEDLRVRRKKRKRLAQRHRQERPAPVLPNVRWSMDFIEDSLAHGRQFRVFTVVDDFSRECLAAEVDLSLSGARAVRVLDQVIAERSKPASIVTDNGSEFTSKVFDQWAYEHEITLDFIRPGKPVENCYIESFHGRFRDECLNQHWFVDLDDARRRIEHWRMDYNAVRPHSSLGYMTPEEFLQGALRSLPATSAPPSPTTQNRPDLSF